MLTLTWGSKSENSVKFSKLQQLYFSQNSTILERDAWLSIEMRNTKNMICSSVLIFDGKEVTVCKFISENDHLHLITDVNCCFSSEMGGRDGNIYT